MSFDNNYSQDSNIIIIQISKHWETKKKYQPGLVAAEGRDETLTPTIKVRLAQSLVAFKPSVSFARLFNTPAYMCVFICSHALFNFLSKLKVRFQKFQIFPSPPFVRDSISFSNSRIKNLIEA